MRFAESRAEQNLDHLNRLGQCRNLHDLLALQTQVVRDNPEAFLQSAQRTSERTTEVARAADRMSAPPSASLETARPLSFPAIGLAHSDIERAPRQVHGPTAAATPSSSGTNMIGQLIEFVVVKLSITNSHVVVRRRLLHRTNSNEPHLSSPICLNLQSRLPPDRNVRRNGLEPIIGRDEAGSARN